MWFIQFTVLGSTASVTKSRSRRPCMLNAAGAVLSPIRRHIRMWRNICRYSCTRYPCAVPATSSGSGGHKKPSSLGTVSSAVWRCGVGRDVADVSNGCSGFSRSTLNMTAVGSFETSAATPHRHRISEDFNLEPSYTVLDELGFLSFHSRCAFHLQARNLRGKCCLAEQCAGLVATVCPSQTRTHRLLQHCGAACW